jgi:hypothetical protein
VGRAHLSGKGTREIQIRFGEDRPMSAQKMQDDFESEFQRKDSAIKGSLVQGLDRELKRIKGFDGRSHDHA